jgi:hypothetical protein
MTRPTTHSNVIRHQSACVNPTLDFDRICYNNIVIGDTIYKSERERDKKQARNHIHANCHTLVDITVLF